MPTTQVQESQVPGLPGGVPIDSGATYHRLPLVEINLPQDIQDQPTKTSRTNLPQDIQDQPTRRPPGPTYFKTSRTNLPQDLQDQPTTKPPGPTYHKIPGTNLSQAGSSTGALFQRATSRQGTLYVMVPNTVTSAGMGA